MVATSGGWSRRRREALTGYALIGPSLLGTTVFLLVPIVLVGWLSLRRWDLISPSTWVGLDNYRDILADPEIRGSLLVTALFVTLVVPAQSLLGLGAALLLHRRLPGAGLLRAGYVIPWVSAPLAVAAVWQWMVDPTNGAVNALTGHRVEWLSEPALALPVVAAIAVWQHVGYVSLFFLAGLESIPAEIYEAATLDRAGALTTLRRITLPLLRPTTFFVVTTGLISSFQTFDLVYGLTRGGPDGRTDVVAARIYFEAFTALRLGRACALAMLLLVGLMMIAVAQRWYFRRRVTYEIS